MTRRHTLVARTLDRVEVHAVEEKIPPAARGQTWYEVRCGGCRATFRVEARTLDRIITRYGFIYCANAFCAERLFAMPNEAVEDKAKARAREAN